MNKKEYPRTAEQYLIEAYEKTKKENLQLKIQNKKLENELKKFNIKEEKPFDENKIAGNKVNTLPTIVTMYGNNINYNYSTYDLNPAKVIELEKRLNAIKQNPKLALKYDSAGYVTVNDLNVLIELYGFKKYGKANVYNNELSLYLYNEKDLSSFEIEYDNLIKKIERNLKEWTTEYKEKWEAKQAKKEANQ